MCADILAADKVWKARPAAAFPSLCKKALFSTLGLDTGDDVRHPPAVWGPQSGWRSPAPCRRWDAVCRTAYEHVASSPQASSSAPDTADCSYSAETTGTQQTVHTQLKWNHRHTTNCSYSPETTGAQQIMSSHNIPSQNGVQKILNSCLNETETVKAKVATCALHRTASVKHWQRFWHCDSWLMIT